jgi:hypothetical protein
LVVPAQFKNTIAATFYDKEFTLFDDEAVVDAYGKVRKGTLSETGSFFGNPRFSKLDAVRQSYGITENIDVVITTNDDIPLNQLFSYAGRYYKVIRSIPFDTHNLLIAQLWLSKSSTLISA